MSAVSAEIATMLVAALLGLLIGLERERKRERTGTIFAGIRTFPLIALFGSLAGLLAEPYGAAMPVAATLAVGALLSLSYWRASSGPKVGGTTEVAAFVAFGLGILAGRGDHVPALAGAVIVTGILSLRDELHGFAGSLDRADLFAVVRFAAVSLVVLPLLPDAALGPRGVWNPRTIWWLVVLISGTSFLGYAAGKAVGARRGVVLGGALGGLASSTAVTMAHARRAREAPALAHPLAVGALVANAVMAPRALIVLALVSPVVAAGLALPALAFALVAGLGALLLHARGRGAPEEGEGTQLRNPFELSSALVFAAVFAALLLVAQLAREWLGEGGIYLTGALAGASQLDAVTLALAGQVERGLEPLVGARAAAIALASNALFKAGLAFASREPGFARATGIPLVLGAVAALALAWLAPLEALLAVLP